MIFPGFAIRLAAGALVASGIARADVPPFQPPMTPLPPECQSLLGAWQSDIQHARSYVFTAWMFVSSDGIGWAAFANYAGGKQFNLDVKPALPVTCSSETAGTITVSGEGNHGGSTTYTRVDDKTLTESRMTNYMGSGPPDPDWKPEAYTVTWKRVAK